MLIWQQSVAATRILTVKDEKIVTKNGVTIIGYTDFPARMGTQAALLYANNMYHMLDDLTPRRDGHLVHNLEDDIIRSTTVSYRGMMMYPPPPLKTQAIATAKPKTPPAKESSNRPAEQAQTKGRQSLLLLLAAALLFGVVGRFAPESFMQTPDSVCAGLLCRVSGDLECFARLAHTADGCDQRNFRNHHRRSIVTNRIRQLAGCPVGSNIGFDCLYQHCWWIFGNAADAGNVPEVLILLNTGPQ